MMIVRTVRREDFPGIMQCAQRAGIGITNLPKNENALKSNVEHAMESFAKEIERPENENYLFVLLDTEKDQIAGTCGIHARIGTTTPYYTFKIDTFDSATHDRRILFLKNWQNGPSEICALYLLPEYRHGGFGKLLSLSRFIFISQYLTRFQTTIFANMRGIVEDGYAPFWDGLGRHFYDISYEEVMKKRADSEEFFKDILPTLPIYAALLDPATQNAIGKTHPHTTPAMNMLIEEGFKEIGEIDPIDGGPILSATLKDVQSVKQTKKATVVNIVPNVVSFHQAIVANGKLDFIATYGKVKQEGNTEVTISKEIADALQISVGETICYRELK